MPEEILTQTSWEKGPKSSLDHVTWSFANHILELLSSKFGHNIDLNRMKDELSFFSECTSRHLWLTDESAIRKCLIETIVLALKLNSSETALDYTANESIKEELEDITSLSEYLHIYIELSYVTSVNKYDLHKLEQEFVDVAHSKFTKLEIQRNRIKFLLSLIRDPSYLAR